ncbi:response regulator transcription factor [Paenibacillus antri]|uniref:Response regulator transcription factor n=1 Tax=Paenibacillus antri TaxID=2582848 RepID=A0A5R9GCI3_9BACL|nr:response regulator transcription factor [Paenibacillus antri]TLS53461.1 response regulator transcription factor [Paenibacillus antri]
MYSVLIVDDEPMIREGLRTLLPWEELGYEVVDTASNGREALRKHELLRPDLMIVDIRMPGMDGLELIEALREVDAGLHILILSGYADFDYAKKAILSRVDGYLLKPVDEDELEQYLRKLKTTLQEERARSKQADRWEEATKEQRVLAALRGGGDAGDGFGWPSYELVLIKLLAREDIDPIVAAAVRKEWAAAYEPTGKGVLFAAEPYVGLLWKHRLEDADARESLLRSLREPCHDRGLDCDAVSGGETSEWDRLESLYERALELMKDRFYYDADELRRYGDAGAPSAAGGPEALSAESASDATRDLEDKLYLAVDVGNADAASRLVDEAGRLMREAGLPEQTLKTRIVQIVSAVVGKLATNRPELQTVDRRLSVDMLALFREYRYDELLRATKSLFHSLMSATEEQGAEKLVKRVVDLIRRNYHENLKLETIAELFHYNSAYLGKVFKQSTGEYFNTYLDKVRIEQAKALLEQGMKVYQVAEQVGYANVDYFHTKFRKYVGTSPSAYKKKE